MSNHVHTATILMACGLFACSAIADTRVKADTRVEIVIGGMCEDEGGNWKPESSPLKSPFGIDFGPRGTMFIVELAGGRVHQLTPSGELKQISGDGSKSFKGDGGPIGSATYNGMHNCAVAPNGDLYIADSWNHRIRKVDHKSRKVSTFAGTGEAGFGGDGGPAAKAKFDFVMCITLNHGNDTIYVADLKNRRIRAIDLKSGIVTTVAGNGQKGVPEDGAKASESPLVDPRAVASDSKGNIYILERGGNALRVVRPDGTIHTVAGTGQRGHRDGPALQSLWGSPKHLCVDDQDNVYVADDTNGAIRKYDARTGVVSTVLGRGFGDKRIRLLHPHGVCWEKGTLYVVDMGHNRILRIVP